MKDTVITAKTKKRELIILASCFAVACIINIICIISYDRSWIEFFSQLGIVTVIAIIFYVVVAIIRLIYLLIVRIFGKR